MIDFSENHTPVGVMTPNWSEDLEEFHEESTRDHPIELLTRAVILSRLDPLPATATIVEIGCSTGYMLEDLREVYPSMRVNRI